MRYGLAAREEIEREGGERLEALLKGAHQLPAESPKHLFETLPDRSDQGPRAPAGYGFDSLEPS